MRNLQVDQAQLDELWTFVFKIEKNLSAWEKLHSEYGDTWVWTAVDLINKLVLAFHVGDHEQKHAEGRMFSVVECSRNETVPEDVFQTPEWNRLKTCNMPRYIKSVKEVGLYP